ncbi:unnamed protein product [Tenebrio molitor]|nr:unnamed protein product [Tenebrio molitor]
MCSGFRRTNHTRNYTNTSSWAIIPQLQELLRMAISKYSSLENDMTDKTMEKRQCKNNSFKINIFYMARFGNCCRLLGKMRQLKQFLAL